MAKKLYKVIYVDESGKRHTVYTNATKMENAIEDAQLHAEENNQGDIKLLSVTLKPTIR